MILIWRLLREKRLRSDMTHPTTEPSDVAVRPIVYAGGAIAVVAALAFALSFGLFRYFIGSEQPTKSEFPPAPRIEIEPAVEYQRLRTEEERKLSSYGWVDRKSGKVRIPIERAIDLQLERGFPTRKEGGKK
jgi:hypothetical protein